MNTTAHRNTHRARAVLCFGALAAWSCGEAHTPRHVFIKLRVVAGETARPTHVELSWLDDTRALFADRRVPEQGTLDPEADPLATVDITPAPGSAGSRRILAFAFEGTRRVLSGSGQLTVSDRGQQVFEVELTSAPEPDHDGDRVPDEIDVCPGQDDFAGCDSPVVLNPDAGKPIGKPPGNPDGGAGDAAFAPPPDGAAIGNDAAVRDGASVIDAPVAPEADGNPIPIADTRPPDPGPDTRPPDPLPKTPPPPTGLSARFENDIVFLSWTDNSNTEEAFVIWRVLGNSTVELGSTPTDVSSFIDRNPARGAAYIYRVAARNTFGFSDASSTTIEIPAPEPIEITGTPFGTSPPFSPGSEFDKAFDGNPGSFFDADASRQDDATCGIDAGQGYVVTRIVYRPRDGYADRMNGGVFQGSNESPTDGFQILHTITGNPSPTDNEVIVPGKPIYRYLRYQTPAGGYGNVAEIEFWGFPAPR